MRIPYTSYPVCGPSPVLAPDGKKHYLHVDASLPSSVGTLILFSTKPSLLMPAGDLTHKLVKIPFTERGVVYGKIELETGIHLNDIHLQGLKYFSSGLDIRYEYNRAADGALADTMTVFNPKREQTISAFTPAQEVLEFERVTNEAIILGAVRSLAMQSEVSAFLF